MNANTNLNLNQLELNSSKITGSLSKQTASPEEKVNKIEAKLERLLKSNNASKSEIIAIKNEAAMYKQLAKIANKIADGLEKKDLKLDKKNEKEIKKVLMEKLGIPAEFVDQLALLAKAGPNALREAANLYEEQAKKIVEDSKLDIRIENLQLDEQKAKDLENLRKDLVQQANGNNYQNLSAGDITFKLNSDSVRERAEQPLKEMIMAQKESQKLEKGAVVAS